MNASLKQSELTELLRSFNEKVYFYPNPGNAGDSLIAAATIQLFKELNLQFEVISSSNFDSKSKIVIYGGGGNFGGADSRVAKVVAKHHQAAKKFIILPHTIFGADELLASLGENCHIFCREKVSYEHVSSCAKKAHVYLHDDLVIGANIKAIRSQITSPKFIRSIAKVVFNRLFKEPDYDFGVSLRSVLGHPFKRCKLRFRPRQKLLNAFRTDVEKTDIAVEPDNVDLSAVYELSSCDPEIAIYTAQLLLGELDKYDRIRTNRLHIAIGAMLLGKQVDLYGNNYYKIKAIYEYSIKDRFSNVRWIQ